MSITGLQSGSFKAMLEEMRKDIAEAQNQGRAEVKAAHTQAAAEIKTTIANVKAKIKAEVSDALQEFAEFSNGGPPLNDASSEQPDEHVTPLPVGPSPSYP